MVWTPSSPLYPASRAAWLLWDELPHSESWYRTLHYWRMGGQVGKLHFPGPGWRMKAAQEAKRSPSSLNNSQKTQRKSKDKDAALTSNNPHQNWRGSSPTTIVETSRSTLCLSLQSYGHGTETSLRFRKVFVTSMGCCGFQGPCFSTWHMQASKGIPYPLGEVEGSNPQGPEATQHGEKGQAQVVPGGKHQEMILAFAVAGGDRKSVV